MPSSIDNSERKSGGNSHRVAFDRFELDLRSGELRKDGRRIRLQAQPFQLLVLLVGQCIEFRFGSWYHLLSCVGSNIF
jgi:DNA-binding response OmpR family regulator